MPHSNDNTLVTAAGDSEIRVFDLEYSGRAPATLGGSPSPLAGRNVVPGGSNVYHGVRYLSEGSTNARVYRSHADRAKRIVTESSPHLFLTCSEDGTVRQWDLRLPSSAYPAPIGGRGLRARRANHDDSNVPPPLISYKKYHLDLTSISCSASQPHYIALGGSHIHCFLHDRRMLGRDQLTERGSPGLDSASEHDDDLMGEATRCVRRFAPNGHKSMRRTDNAHVTACKISDANPNEMIGSWSGDHIYSFDLVRSPDARELKDAKSTSVVGGRGNSQAKESRDRKRKRKQQNSSTSSEGLKRGSSQPRRSGDSEDGGDVVLRVRYGNGQSEDIPIEASVPESTLEEARESVRNESQKRSLRIAKSTVKIRKLLCSLDITARNTDEHESQPLSHHTSSFTAALGHAAGLIPDMNEVIHTWRYPVDPLPEQVAFHKRLRQNRDAAWRFVQGAGTLARVLGGKLRTASRGQPPALQYFDRVKPAATEARKGSNRPIFAYEFLKAILLWLDGGREALLDGFKKTSGPKLNEGRPIPEEADESGIEDHLIPYLIKLSSLRTIPNVDASRFEIDERRIVFPNETSAIIAFSHAVRIPLQDMSRALAFSQSNGGNDVETAPSQRIEAQDRSVALKYWGFKVGRGLLMNAGEGVDFTFVDRAYGGIGQAESIDEGRSQEEIDPNAEEQPVESFEVLNRTSNGTTLNDTQDEEDSTILTPGSSSETLTANQTAFTPSNKSEEGVLMSDLESGLIDHILEGDEDNGNDDEAGERGEDDDLNEEVDEDENDDGDDDDDHDDGDSDADIPLEDRRFIWHSASTRARLREQVQKKVPVDTHTRQYRGHCNVKTVKDVNYFGLQDEYVMSGSDSGHVFIWDKKTTQLVNILEGDGEVVNVLQGKSFWIFSKCSP